MGSNGPDRAGPSKCLGAWPEVLYSIDAAENGDLITKDIDLNAGTFYSPLSFVRTTSFGYRQTKRGSRGSRESSGNWLTLATAVAVVGIPCLWANDRKTNNSASSFKAHPQVFSMIGCWISDAESPVVTEINLDAAEKNRNQFSGDMIKQKDGWTIFHEADTGGFKRYRLIETKDNHYKVEFQENGGGTLTTASIIEFTVEKREIRKNGEPTTIRVLRVDSYSSK
ncbi:MAG: hypothetical protein WCS65_00470 [Verrucomicrobiae bacterium]